MRRARSPSAGNLGFRRPLELPMESRVAAELEPGPAWGNQPERPTATTFTRVASQGICFHTSFLRSDRSVDY